jgi:hypothetical protein
MYIFDALDVCCERDQSHLIERLRTFHYQAPMLVKDTQKFLVTSRPYNHLNDHVRAITDSFPHPYVRLRAEQENERIR